MLIVSGSYQNYCVESDIGREGESDVVKTPVKRLNKWVATRDAT